jgi:hypothetical protein
MSALGGQRRLTWSFSLSRPMSAMGGKLPLLERVEAPMAANLNGAPEWLSKG